ncbi:MAG: DNA polymerase III subunit delta' [Prevotella sp.]|nr:DNA polymerase III subunit delta' [Prevotella sp.]
MRFDEVIGQEEIRARLVQMVEKGRLPHALLFCGPAGCGKMAMAMAYASYLLCENRNREKQACNECKSCVMLRKWQHPDLHFSYPVIKPAGTSADHKMVSDDFAQEWNTLLMQGPYFSIDQWLEQMHAANQQAVIYAGESDELARKLSLKSSRGGYKVCIIWLPERMNAECANKLLKLIEEPPRQTVFIMVCEEPERLIETIRSRTQRIDFKRIGTETMVKALVQQRGIDESSAHRIARTANGNWLKALEELDAGNENRQFLDVFIMLMRLAYMRNVKELKKWSETVAGYGREKQKRMMTYFLRLVRENFMYNFGRPELIYMTQREEDFARNFAKFINEANVVEMAELFSKTIRDIAQNANPKIVFFDLALQVTLLLLQK